MVRDSLEAMVISASDSGREQPKRQTRGAQTRGSIVAAVLRLLAREGPGAVTHRAVAREAGVSLSATSYYFNSKAEMLAEAFRRHMDEQRVHIDELVESYGWRGPTRRRPLGPDEIGALYEGYVAAELNRPAEERLASVELMLALARDGDLRSSVRARRAGMRRFMVDMLRRAGSSDPSEDAELIVSTLNGLVLEQLSRGDDARYSRRAARLAARQLRDLLAAAAH